MCGPELNPVDYAVWGALQQLVYKRRSFMSIAELKLAIVSAWQQLSQTKASTNGVVALWYSRMGAISKICLNNELDRL